MNRKELARLLERAAELMEVLGEGGHRVWAYRRAARALERHEEDLEVLAQRGFRGVPGVGRGMAVLLGEVYRTGEFSYLEELLARIPPGVQELLNVQGLGPKRVRALWEAGVDSLEALVAWAEAGRIRRLPGFGARSEQALLEAARFALANARRVHLSTGLEVARLLLEDLAGAGIRAEVAGSLRRGLETVGNVDLVALAPPERVVAALGVHAERVEGRVVHGRVEGVPLKVFTAREAEFGTVLLQATGSRAFLEALGPLPTLPDEAAVFAALGRAFVPPFWREPEHAGQAPPARVVGREDLAGLIHAHTTYSDGMASLREMAEAALARGYRYLVISDHSQAAAYAGGLTPAALEAQWAEIDRLNAELAPFRILKGIEADILPDGRLDYPEEVLARFDVVIGSLHSHLSLDPEAQTARLLRALDTPYLTILGHATGRLLLRRKGAAADWARVLERAAERGVILEINANPWRLDLDWRVALAWRDRLLFSLGPDAHAVEGMDDVDYGLLMAAKAGLPPERVVNTWTAEALLEHAGRHR